MELRPLDLPDGEITLEQFERWFRPCLDMHYRRALLMLQTFNPVHASTIANLLWFAVQKRPLYPSLVDRIMHRLQNWYDVYVSCLGTPDQVRADIETGTFLRGLLLNNFEEDVIRGVGRVGSLPVHVGRINYEGFE